MKAIAMPTIKDIGGEFGLIDHLSKITPAQAADVIVGIGDDAAVLRTAPEPAPYLLVTTDMLVQDRHFRRNWASAEEIGVKAVESNASDIAAMGGRPNWMFVSLVLPGDTTLDWAEGLYRGMAASCRRHGIVLAGGDTTEGAAVVINITLLGMVAASHLCLRNGAAAGDRIAVTGQLGASAAALALLEKGLRPSDYLLTKHKTPACRLDISDRIAPLATAMIDISDGLAAEVNHICKRSGLGAELLAASIPLHPDVVQAAQTLDAEPLDFALGGGEDYELLFTVSPDDLQKLKLSGTPVYDIGVVTGRGLSPALIHPNGTRSVLKGGYDHFAP